MSTTTAQPPPADPRRADAPDLHDVMDHVLRAQVALGGSAPLPPTPLDLAVALTHLCMAVTTLASRALDPAAPPPGPLAGAWVALPVAASAQRCYVNLGAGRFWYAVHTVALGEHPAGIALHHGHLRGRDLDADEYSEQFEGGEADALNAALAALSGGGR